MYETYYDLIHPCFKERNLHLQYMDTDSFILTVNTEDIIKDLKHLEDMFNFSNLDKNHEIISNKNEKLLGEFKIETPKNFWIDEFIAWRSKVYSFKCGDDSRNKLKGISKSQSKHMKLKNITIEYLVEKIKNIVINILFVQLSMKCIFKK